LVVFDKLDLYVDLPPIRIGSWDYSHSHIHTSHHVPP
jgi:hypothetical protein